MCLNGCKIISDSSRLWVVSGWDLLVHYETVEKKEIYTKRQKQIRKARLQPTPELKIVTYQQQIGNEFWLGERDFDRKVVNYGRRIEKKERVSWQPDVPM